MRTRVNTSASPRGMRTAGVAAVVGAGLLAVGAMSASAAPVSDEFDGTTLDESVWSIVDPVGDGEVTVSDGALRLRVPEGEDHDASVPNESLRVMQAADDGDMSIEVKFDSLPSERFQDQGILVEQDDGNWLRFDLFSDGTRFIGFAASSSSSDEFNGLFRTTVNPAPSQRLRVTREGDRWTQEYSRDGATWEPLADFDFALEVERVGVYSGNYDGTGAAPEFTAEVDYFRVAGDTPEPPVAGCATDLTTRDWAGIRGGSMTPGAEGADYVSGRQLISGATTPIGAAERGVGRRGSIRIAVEPTSRNRHARTWLMAYNGRSHRRIASLDRLAGRGERTIPVRLSNLEAVRVVTLGGRRSPDRFTLSTLELRPSECGPPAS